MPGHICPKCNGRGINPENTSLQCEKCKGHGVVWDIPNHTSKESYNPDGILGKVRL